LGGALDISARCFITIEKDLLLGTSHTGFMEAAPPLLGAEGGALELRSPLLTPAAPAAAAAAASPLTTESAALGSGSPRGGALCLNPLDGVRGLASLLIVSGHFFTFWAPRDASTIFPVLALD
jgi:hypothetical protein